jgi:hypothetical protein
MIRALELCHHAGPYTIPFVEGEPEHATVYRYIRQSQCFAHFLTEDNHLVSFPYDEFGNRERHLRIARPSRAFDSNGPEWWVNHWFGQSWQLINPETYDERIAEAESRSIANWMLAEQCRDTVRGRKARRDYDGLVREYQRQIRVYKKQKQNLIGGVYGFGW